ncbi:MAG: efflux RND transporter periplasmic adaptor subunit [Burkholderiaceae bacterium]|nr:efflux RND transporter periplasmic adaptor subunit [Burkholderiaceae bacterium]
MNDIHRDGAAPGRAPRSHARGLDRAGRFAAAALAAAAFALSVASARALAESDPPAVDTVEVRARPVRSALEFDATLEAVRQSTVAAQVSGNVVERLVRAGDPVRAGQPLARIDARDAQAAVARSDAAIAQARAERVDAQAAWERNRALVERGFLSRSALDGSQARLDAAKAAERQAIAGAQQATLARSFTTVVAPYDGIVLATLVEAGDLAVPGRGVATLYQPGAIRVVVHVPLSALSSAQDARRVEVVFANGQILVPSLRTFVPGVDPVAQTRELRLEFAESVKVPGVPGQRARVRFDGAEVVRRTIPQRAVLRRGELDAVYVARGDRFALRAIRLGSAHGDEVEVLGGLAEGERVAADPVRAGLADSIPRATPRAAAR